MRCASSRSSAATTADAGRLRAISAARFGPDSAATRAGAMPPASAMTSLIRSSVPRSRPLTTDSTSAPAARCGAHRADDRPQVRRRRGEDHEVGGRGEVGRVGRRDERSRGRSTPGQPALVAAASRRSRRPTSPRSGRAGAPARAARRSRRASCPTPRPDDRDARARAISATGGSVAALGRRGGLATGAEPAPSCVAAASPRPGRGTPGGSASRRTRTSRAAGSRGSAGTRSGRADASEAKNTNVGGAMAACVA